MTTDARRLWQLVEPIHAVTYFASESHAAFEAAGLRGFWRGYFAGRAAPLGEAGAGAVTVTFYGFHPSFVARAVPGIWAAVSPSAAIDARRRGVDGALRRILGADVDGPAVVAAAARAREAAEACTPGGRPLFAANAELGWPAEPHLVLWHAATLLREHRGDGHVAALVAAGVDPCEAHVSQVAASGASPDTIQPYRGWSEEYWAGATERLRSRGWLDARGALTPAGLAGRAAIEDETDELAAAPVEGLLDLLAPITARILDSDTIPYPNPMGVPRPEVL